MCFSRNVATMVDKNKHLSVASSVGTSAFANFTRLAKNFLSYSKLCTQKSLNT